MKSITEGIREYAEADKENINRIKWGTVTFIIQNGIVVRDEYGGSSNRDELVKSRKLKE